MDEVNLPYDVNFIPSYTAQVEGLSISGGEYTPYVVASIKEGVLEGLDVAFGNFRFVGEGENQRMQYQVLIVNEEITAEEQNKLFEENDFLISNLASKIFYDVENLEFADEDDEEQQ